MACHLVLAPEIRLRASRSQVREVATARPWKFGWFGPSTRFSRLVLFPAIVEPSLFLVTGASSGIGRMTAIALASAGAEVLAVGRRASALAETAAQGQGRIVTVEADVTVGLARAEIRRAVAGRSLSGLFHGAGIFPRGRLETMDLEGWRKAMATNVDARLHLVMDLRESLAGGRVLFPGSDASVNPRAGGAAYSVSKVASEMLWRCLCLELGDRIGFAIAKPGLVETQMLTDSIGASEEDFPARGVYVGMVERGETIAPEKIGAFFRWLLLEVPDGEFAGSRWDVRDAHHHEHWLRGELYSGKKSSSTPPSRS
ncbi:MAG: SDR family NAD(P)-dependent oxidoreductase [Candidatus Binatia bacterium]|nr:SDR family NAD(P)-dependent oxidoreductase [Candidatus Binatia bacterium]MDG2008171.1 SDR family NAD(P)-dependent oxidoreductase [Candidatus Binatia bacterium]